MYPLIAKWTLLPGSETEVIAALKDLAAQVQQEEPGTLMYMVFTPDFAEKSLPTPPLDEVIFFEIYKDKDASIAHINGKAFQGFLKNYGHLFLNDFSTPPQPYMSIEVMKQEAGFLREGLECDS